MMKHLYRGLLSSVFLTSMLLPGIVLAQYEPGDQGFIVPTPPPTSIDDAARTPGSNQPPPTSIDDAARTPGSESSGSQSQTTGFITLKNPLKVDSLSELLLLILDILLLFAVPIIVFFIIYAGFLFVTAQGNEERLKKAKNALLWTVVGGVIVLGAKLILEVIEGTVKALGA